MYNFFLKENSCIEVESEDSLTETEIQGLREGIGEKMLLTFFYLMILPDALVSLLYASTSFRNLKVLHQIGRI